MKDAVDADKQQEMGDRLNKGIFTLRDMYEQFQVIYFHYMRNKYGIDRLNGWCRVL